MKECIINLRVTKKEKDMISKKAKKLNRTITSYLVGSADKQVIKILDSDSKVETELRRIGNNINQLTRLANSGVINCVDLSEVKTELRNIWRVLADMYSNY